MTQFIGQLRAVLDRSGTHGHRKVAIKVGTGSRKRAGSLPPVGVATIIVPDYLDTVMSYLQVCMPLAIYSRHG